jgi:hypothetical protein
LPGVFRDSGNESGWLLLALISWNVFGRTLFLFFLSISLLSLHPTTACLAPVCGLKIPFLVSHHLLGKSLSRRFPHNELKETEKEREVDRFRASDKEQDVFTYNSFTTPAAMVITQY